MKTLIFTLVLSAFTYASSSIEVNIHNKITKVSQKDLVRLYLKKSNTINGIKVIPLDTKDRELFKEFYQKIIQKTPKQLHAYWMKEIYRGDKQPPKKLSPKELKKITKQKVAVMTYEKNPKTGQILITIK